MRLSTMTPRRLWGFPQLPLNEPRSLFLSSAFRQEDRRGRDADEKSGMGVQSMSMERCTGGRTVLRRDVVTDVRVGCACDDMTGIQADLSTLIIKRLRMGSSDGDVSILGLISAPGTSASPRRVSSAFVTSALAAAVMGI